MSHNSCEHRHKIKCKTFHCEDHAHTVKGETSYADNVCNHTHTLCGCSTTKDGHEHKFTIQLGPAVPMECGGHCHFVDDETDHCYGHYHDVCFELTDKKVDIC